MPPKQLTVREDKPHVFMPCEIHHAFSFTNQPQLTTDNLQKMEQNGTKKLLHTKLERRMSNRDLSPSEAPVLLWL